MVRHLDLFSGIGGFALAARMVGGIETVGFCEIDPWARRVLNKNFPGVPVHGDIKTFEGTEYGTVDLITGGYPCQPFSHAGKRGGANMTATSGRKCAELLRRQDRVTSWLKMLLGMSQWASTKCFLKWKASATPAGRSLYRLVPWAPPIGGIGSGLWATPTANLSIAASMEASAKEAARLHPQGRYTLATQIAERHPDLNGQLNPEWVEWLQGYPTTWTALED